MESVILKRISDRLHKRNQNYLAIVTGPTGSGKSYSALRLAELLDKDFNINRVVFSSDAFMQLLDEGNLKRGDIILWDEAGVGISARAFMTVSNRVISYFLQGFRSLNIGVLFTLPTMSMIDVNVQRLAHAFIETKQIIRSQNKCVLKYLELQTNALTGKVYRKYPRIYLDGKTVMVQSIKVGKPSVKMQHEYEKRKKEWLTNLATSVHGIVKGLDKKEIQEPKKDLSVFIDEVVKNRDIFVRCIGKREYVHLQTLENKFNISRPDAEKIKNSVEEKLKIGVYNTQHTKRVSESV